MKNSLNSSFAYPLLNRDHFLFPEKYFLNMFVLESKRTERSGRNFLLVLLDVHKLLKKKNSNELLRKLTSVLYNTTREIDVKGWYKQDNIIGVIYTEISGIQNELVKKKIRDNINKTLDPEDTAMIAVSSYIFPETNEINGQKENRALSNYSALCRDVSLHTISQRVSAALKRVIDISASAAGILLLSPLLLGISFLVKISSPGPVLFRQKRVGYGGKEFTFLKFRSMFIDNNEGIHKEFTKNFIHGNSTGNNNAREGIYKIKADHRITGVGRFLRKVSLDELPQLFNVLKGDMSLVGPRPAIRYEVDEYDTWHTRRVLEVKPGITGVWQVKGRSKTTFDEMVRMDIQYIKKWSLLLDVFLILKTPMAVIKTDGAY